MHVGAGDEESNNPGLYRVLVKRFSSLESSHKKLLEQFNLLLQEKKEERNGTLINMDSNEMDFCIPGYFYTGSPYRNVLNYMGHAVHVSRAGTGEIIYWNRSAERLYGYKDHEVLGQITTEFLICEEYHELARIAKERLSSGQSWSGLFPCKKRSGQIFMGMLTKSPLYEDGELFGIITVSNDAALFININSKDTSSTHEEDNDHQPGAQGINFKRIQWNQRPQIASSVSNLASKVFSLKRGEDACDASADVRARDEADFDTKEGKPLKPPRAPVARLSFSLLGAKNRANAESSEKDESTFGVAQPSKIAAKVMSKLSIGGFGNLGKEKGQRNGDDDTPVCENVAEPHSPTAPDSTEKCCHFVDAQPRLPRNQKGACCDPGRTWAPTTSHGVVEGPPGQGPVQNFRNPYTSKPGSAFAGGSSSRNSNEFFEALEAHEEIPGTFMNNEDLKKQFENSKSSGAKDSSQQLSEHHQSPKSGGSTDSRGSSSNKIENELSLIVVDCEILWEDISLKEEMGRGSYGVVYHGIWSGSDVAVKVYFANQCSEETLLNYKKEVEIMKRLRHPNVLLFMGAVFSQEKPAIVTEFLPRGSLFKTLHGNSQPLDFKRRLRMALDVARGMNYLHRRNPPIVHRDLKSSNLLVDKSWTVKVGDFGLSRFRDATFLTTKSEGTPQWMAPEVLRNEPSTEKSDVFSFGVILWELMTESIPWSNLNSLQVVGIVGFMDRRLEIPENLDTRVSAVIIDCWQSNPALRPSFQDIIQRTRDIILSFTGLTAGRKNTGT